MPISISSWKFSHSDEKSEKYCQNDIHDILSIDFQLERFHQQNPPTHPESLFPETFVMSFHKI